MRITRIRGTRPLNAAVFFCVQLLSSAPATGQGTASVEGIVRDSTGAVIPGVDVIAINLDTGIERRLATDSAGAYRMIGLGTAEHYEVLTKLNGFRDIRRRIESLRAGERRIVDFRLEPLGLSEQVDVTPDLPLAQTTTPELGGTLSQDQVDRLPVNGRDLLSLAYLIPGAAPARGFYNLAPRLTINGSSSLVTSYTVDGFDNTDLFLGGPKVPITIGSTQNLTVLVNSYASEYGRTGNGVFAVTTRSGTNQFTGDLFYVVRPGSVLDSPNFFAPRDASGHIVDEGFRRQQVGGSIGGPLRRDRTFYFVNAEITRERQDAILTSPLSVGRAPTSFHNQALMGKIDHRWSAGQTSSMRYLLSDYTHDGDIGFTGGLTLPSAGLQVNYQTQVAAFTHTSNFSRGGFNEMGAQVSRLRADWRSLDPGPRALVTDRGRTLAIIGAVSDNFFWTEQDFQIRDVYSAIAGRHSLRAGGDLLRGLFDIRSGPGARGAYIIDLNGRAVVPGGPFLTIRDLPRDPSVLQYSQTFINPQVRRPQVLAALFAEDTVRLSSDLTVTLGARWDYDSITNTPEGSPDVNNIAPRMGFNWTPATSGRHALRGGYGIFYERIPFAVYSDTVFNSADGGAIGVTFVPGTPFPPPAFPNPLPRNAIDNVLFSSLPPRNVQTFDPRLESPRNQQISLGYVFSPARDLTVAVDYVHNRGEHLIRRIDINAPASIRPGVTRSVAEADASRPLRPGPGGFRLIEQDESTGHSRFNGIYLNARRRFGERFAFDLAYTLSRVENDTDDINFRPVDSRDPDAEFAPSLNDRRHVVALNGRVRLPFELDVVPVLFLSSGQPLNVTTGRDDNGDTIFNDRPAGVGRNSERTTGFRQLDVGVIREIQVKQTRIELRTEIFNLFNTTNFAGFFNYGASGVRPDEDGTLAFQPTVAGPARQFQFTARLRF